jgi:hypothetical protein
MWNDRMDERQAITAPLAYMPQTFRRCKSEVWKFIYLGGMVTAGVVIFDWFHPGESFAVLISQATVLMLIAAGGIVAAIQRWTVDCRIEGTTLTIENRPRLAPVSVQVSDITEIITLVNSESANEHEMVVHGRGRINVGPELFTPLAPLKAALLEINPRISFTQRPGEICFACGHPLVSPGASFSKAIEILRSRRCMNCGESSPKRSRFN